ncbi:MAG: response regulator [Chitinivibrionales bacterium]|nr:response regulator [Chitinivibrionales bacterium]
MPQYIYSVYNEFAKQQDIRFKGVCMRVLVVEDEVSYLAFLEELCLDEGYEVLKADNGTEALEILSRQKVDIIISDLMVPGVGGVELLYKLREHKVPIITISGLSREVVISELLKELGIVSVLQKPFDSQVLIRAIQEETTGQD